MQVVLSNSFCHVSHFFCFGVLKYILLLFAVAQAKNMARSGLDAFAVNDREDVFVVSEMDSNEKDEDIFYMR